MWTRRRRVNQGWSWVRGAWVAILTTAAGLTFLTLAGRFEEIYGLDALFWMRGAAARAPPGVVLVAINGDSASALDVSSVSERWPRALHAALIRSLVSRGAAAIVFDLRFSEPSIDRDDDVLACAMREGNVLLLEDLERRSSTQSKGQGSRNLTVDITHEPIRILADAAVAIASFPLPDPSARVTRFWMFRPGTDMATLPVVALQVAAQDIRKDWADLLATEGDLPAEPLAWEDPRILGSMIALRSRLRARPEAAQRLRAAVDKLAPAKAKRLSTLVSLYSGGDTKLLNFRGPPGTISVIPYDSLLAKVEGAESSDAQQDLRCPTGASKWIPKPPGGVEDSALSHLIRGNIVVVGLAETARATQKDTFQTAFRGKDGVKLGGAEILATSVADLMESASLRTSAIANILIVAGVASVIGMAAASASTVAIAAAFAGLLAGTLFVGHYLFAAANLAVPVFTPNVVELPVGILLSLWSLRAAEIKLRRTIDSAVRQFLPADVVEALARGPLPATAVPEGETRFTVCLETDVEGFTTLSERLAPKVLHKLLNDYFRALFEAVQRNGGRIANVTGDAIMCTWTTADDPLQARANAVQATLQMVDLVTEFNTEHPDSLLPTRFGLHAGFASFGAVGGAGHFAATLVGDVANTASRIESANKHLRTRVLASEEVLADVDGIVIRRLGAFILMGRSKPVQLAEILGRAGGSPQAIALANTFAQGLAAYQAEHWTEAAELFHALQKTYPDDGPILFFLRRAEKFSQCPPPPGAEWAIQMESK